MANPFPLMAMSYDLDTIYAEVFGSAEYLPGTGQISFVQVPDGVISTQTTMTEFRIYHIAGVNDVTWATQVTCINGGSDLEFKSFSEEYPPIPEDIRKKLYDAMKKHLNPQPISDNDFINFMRSTL